MNPCQNCQYKVDLTGEGYCYMFRQEPKEPCQLHKPEQVRFYNLLDFDVRRKEKQELEKARMQNYTEDQLAEIKRLYPICEDEETATIFQWQLTDLMVGLGSSEDHEDVKAELRKLPLTENCVNLLHAVIVNSLKGLK